ncbi:hypothetical protein A2230_01760 [candidate division WOR-1 bacterium RIFOXYA2_FULL_36_21]|uniref:Uncharacterized protein n=1 Tax=candidate division WOR-1 bacterium RIFOXYB2_FULL_36_35 TaxID=1802578 RepID=A0A1F4S7C5_UNCSA|nr:MAG: hypothetical protein A2230_01760 [candidate division WOR-1 bacterium RIFOXYA2_FULL_36_21]OGC16090.1 MAG: hypothetical protein A2282_05440 [candidate division WOR-1 bacterium RIFOXYA12_FULL_36_13]OGC16336.1 MAG: hypothetical protein A2290_04485 [candidate division WOR-1 bacterium RIFOXYB2_FULL_36_35]
MLNKTTIRFPEFVKKFGRGFFSWDRGGIGVVANAGQNKAVILGMRKIDFSNAKLNLLDSSLVYDILRGEKGRSVDIELLSQLDKVPEEVIAYLNEDAGNYFAFSYDPTPRLIIHRASRAQSELISVDSGTILDLALTFPGNRTYPLIPLEFSCVMDNRRKELCYFPDCNSDSSSHFPFVFNGLNSRDPKNDVFLKREFALFNKAMILGRLTCKFYDIGSFKFLNQYLGMDLCEAMENFSIFWFVRTTFARGGRVAVFPSCEKHFTYLLNFRKLLIENEFICDNTAFRAALGQC